MTCAIWIQKMDKIPGRVEKSVASSLLRLQVFYVSLSQLLYSVTIGQFKSTGWRCGSNFHLIFEFFITYKRIFGLPFSFFSIFFLYFEADTKSSGQTLSNKAFTMHQIIKDNYWISFYSKLITNLKFRFIWLTNLIM